MTIAI